MVNEKEIQPTASLFRNIHELTLDRFINVLVDGDYNDLIKSGSATESELQDAWQLIIDEYNIQMGDGTVEVVATISLYKSILKSDFDIKAVESFVAILREFYVDKMAKAINKILRTNFRFDYSNRSEYENELDRCLKRLGGIKIKLELDRQKLKQRESVVLGKPVAKPTRNHFVTLIIAISDHAGYNIKESDISVYKFCERVKRLNKAIEQHQETRGKK